MAKVLFQGVKHECERDPYMNLYSRISAKSLTLSKVQEILHIPAQVGVVIQPAHLNWPNEDHGTIWEVILIPNCTNDLIQMELSTLDRQSADWVKLNQKYVDVHCRQIRFCAQNDFMEKVWEAEEAKHPKLTLAHPFDTAFLVLGYEEGMIELLASHFFVEKVFAHIEHLFPGKIIKHNRIECKIPDYHLIMPANRVKISSIVLRRATIWCVYLFDLANKPLLLAHNNALEFRGQCESHLHSYTNRLKRLFEIEQETIRKSEEEMKTRMVETLGSRANFMEIPSNPN